MLTKHYVPWKHFVTTYYDKFYKIYQREKKGQQVRKSDGGLYKEYLEYGLVDHIITVTKNAKESLINLFDIKEDRITVINNGIDIDGQSFRVKDRGVLRKKYGFEENTLVVIFSGSINKRKGIQELVDVFEILCDKHRNIRLVVAGLCNRTSVYDRRLSRLSVDVRVRTD